MRTRGVNMPFDHYFLLKESDVISYVKEKLDFFAPGAQLEVKEIGDGNVNYVFRVREPSTGKSLIVKQAGEQLRISPDFNISTDRNRIETEILLLQHSFVPGLVPKIFFHDTLMCACVMEDLSDYQLMRHAMMEHKTFPRFADDITNYLVHTLLKTSDAAMEHKAKKALVKSFINPELCEITEDLVYTEPYIDVKKRNIVLPANAAFVQKELYEDNALHLEIAKLKFSFMNNAQALIHGDLHTGSIFVKQDGTKVFDPEFAFFGPMGFDIGNIIANLFFAWDNGNAAGAKSFCDWVLETVVLIIDLFKKKFLDLYPSVATDIIAKTQGFAEYYLDTIIADTAAAVGTELIRRTVGMAPVKDMAIANERKRVAAERVNILAAKDFIFNRLSIISGGDFKETFLKAVDKVGVHDS
jgi:5-methylthioribose kinase